MIFLVILPVISMFIWIIGAIIGACKMIDGKYGDNVSINTKMPDGEEYKDKVGTPDRDHPSIAQQFDGRLTNVFKNPMEGIL